MFDHESLLQRSITFFMLSFQEQVASSPFVRGLSSHSSWNFFLYILKQIYSFDTTVLIENMRPLTAEETTTLFEKLAK